MDTSPIDILQDLSGKEIVIATRSGIRRVTFILMDEVT